MVINQVTGKTLIVSLVHSDTFLKRLCGLLPYRTLPDGEGMLITPCNSVHTWFMRFNIDVLYLNEDLQVVAAFDNVPPWRFLPIKKQARSVLELPAGKIAETGTEAGHQLQLS